MDINLPSAKANVITRLDKGKDKTTGLLKDGSIPHKEFDTK